MAVDPARLALGRRAQQLAEGYYSFLVAHHVASNPRAENLLRLGPDGGGEIGEIQRNDRTAHKLDLRHYLEQLRVNRDFQREFLRTWAMGALISLGDALQEHLYFDHAPILEMVYHLRNGMAHGGKFNIDNRGKKRLGKYPAHNHQSIANSPMGTRFEIVETTSGNILWDFMGPADVIDLFQSVGWHLDNPPASP